LVPVTSGAPVLGELTLWSASDAGTVVTIRVRTGLGAVTSLRGERVWVVTRPDGDGGLVVFQAVGQVVSPERDELELTGVTWLAAETRRTALRAQVARPVLLVRDGVPSRGTQTVDLSSTGCRVQLPEGQTLTAGERLQAAVDTQDGSTVWVRSEVVRVDEGLAQVALRFVDLTVEDRDLIDRDVLAWFSAQRA
jgi:hypothetical protein